MEPVKWIKYIYKNQSINQIIHSNYPNDGWGVTQGCWDHLPSRKVIVPAGLNL